MREISWGYFQKVGLTAGRVVYAEGLRSRATRLFAAGHANSLSIDLGVPAWLHDEPQSAWGRLSTRARNSLFPLG